jgi:hypothetical protein
MIFVAPGIENLVEVERLLPCTELNFYRSAGAVNRGELTHVGLRSAQMGHHEARRMMKI